MARILILIGSHLCMAPRPQKEAEALASAGHDVLVRGFWHNSLFAERDRAIAAGRGWRFEPIVDFRPISMASRLSNLNIRLRWRVAREGYTRFKVATPSLLGYGAKAMLKAALKARADLTIVHSEVGLWVGANLIDQGFKVGVDFEDWFSEDLLPEARLARPVAQLKELEYRLLREAAYSLTTSQVLADALALAYGAPKPTVIYNAFPWAERSQIDQKREDRRDPTVPSLYWFSQTIGPGRGIENLLAALPHIKQPLEVHLRGRYTEDVRRWMEPLIPEDWHGRVFLHETVPPEQLLSRTAEHDIGLALEVSDVPSRALTVTNKVFQYMQAGLAVIATATPGQLEVFRQAGTAGKIIPANNPLSLAQSIHWLTSSPGRLQEAKSAALKTTQEVFCWEKQQGKLQRVAARALEPDGSIKPITPAHPSNPTIGSR